MDLQQSDFDRLLFFEHARKTAEATYAKNPLDSDVGFLYGLITVCLWFDCYLCRLFERFIFYYFCFRFC